MVLLFDMDGTILNTLDDICDSVNYSLNRYGLKSITLNECKSFVGNGPKVLIKKALKNNDVYFNEVYDTYMNYYDKHSFIKTKPYDGIIELLYKLKSLGYKLGVVSNKQDSAVKLLCDKYFKGIFDLSIGSSERVLKKPAKDMIEKALHILNEKDCIYIGDSEVDVKTALNANVLGVFVLWGFRDKDILEASGAKYLVKNIDELYSFIKK